MRLHPKLAAFLAAALLLPAAPLLGSDEGTAYAANPLPILVRDPGIRSQLQLTDSQVESLERLLAEWDERLFGLRILSPEKDSDRIREVVAGFEEGLARILEPQQKARLEELRLQALGWQALLRDDVAQRLGLSESQRAKITKILEETRAKTQKLPGGSERELKRLRTAERDRVAGVLTAAQKREWAQAIGTIHDMSGVRQIAARAPELRDVTEWLNGEPLTLESLRGRVVVVHYFAANCINCVRNMPHYRKWDEQFADADVLLIGIHTPETPTERKVEHVRKKVQEYGLESRVAIDNEGRNWDAWTNRIWPAVYLIDKQGNIRFWWYGELEWQGAGGEKWMRERIEMLLAESPAEN